MTAVRRYGGRAVRGRVDISVSATVRTPLSKAAAAKLAEAVIRAERADVAALSIAFVGPQRIRRLNREHLGRDCSTDVIAFSLTALPPYRPAAIIGDVYICPAVAAKSAKEHRTSAQDEVRRLVVHGVLHVLGHDHPETARTSSAMWQVQERHLARMSKALR